MAFRTDDAPETRNPHAAPPQKTFVSFPKTRHLRNMKTFMSFPRTRHLYNLGAATADDEVENDADGSLATTGSDMVTSLEKKIDGANMGIQVDTETETGFQVQSRKRFLTADPGNEFKQVNKWVLDHREDLRKVLLGGDEGEELLPGRYILYGEWMYAMHEIHYQNLPDIFVAFDMYDTEDDTFLSRMALNRKLGGTQIYQVAAVPLPTELNGQSLQDLVGTLTSAYYDGPAEGIYLRREKGDRLMDRAKIVRENFGRGNEGRSKGTEKKGMVLNQLAKEAQ